MARVEKVGSVFVVRHPSGEALKSGAGNPLFFRTAQEAGKAARTLDRSFLGQGHRDKGPTAEETAARVNAPTERGTEDPPPEERTPAEKKLEAAMHKYTEALNAVEKSQGVANYAQQQDLMEKYAIAQGAVIEAKAEAVKARSTESAIRSAMNAGKVRANREMQGKSIQQGPRGGLYYDSASGSKVYVTNK